MKQVQVLAVGMAAMAAIAAMAVMMVFAAFMLGRLSAVTNFADGWASDPRPALLPVPHAMTVEALRAHVDRLVACASQQDFAGDLALPCRQALEGGKRLRAIIVLLAAHAARPGADAGEMALAVEYMHNASLVVDDMPLFDNDHTRRGRPSVHAAHGSRAALMAALTLVGAAMRNVGRQLDNSRRAGLGAEGAATVVQAVGRTLADAAHGQHLDMMTPGARDGWKATNRGDFMETLFADKTASFFRAALVGGWLCAGGRPTAAADLSRAAHCLGVAFQLADDLGDMTKDADRQAWNYGLEHGAAATANRYNAHMAEAQTILQGLGIWSPAWDQIAASFARMAVDTPPPVAAALPTQLELENKGPQPVTASA